MKSVEVREDLINALRLDLVGPGPGHQHENEILPQAPSRWYLTGFLVPYEAPESQRRDAVSDEQIDLPGMAGGTDDDERPERASGRKVFLPSSLGVSVLVPENCQVIKVARFGAITGSFSLVGGLKETEQAHPRVVHLNNGNERKESLIWPFLFLSQQTSQFVLTSRKAAASESSHLFAP